MDPRERLIVALDVPSLDAAQAMVARLGSAVSFYKIGYQLAYAGGLSLVRPLADAGTKGAAQPLWERLQFDMTYKF